MKKGFDIKAVTWGYRDKFLEMIDSLYDDKLLGGENEEATQTFFSLMSKAGSDNSFDHVLIKFLESLNPSRRWIMRIPSLFSDWSALGSEFASEKLYYGIKYFELWGKGGFGDSPSELSYVIDKARFLNGIDMDLGFTFIKAFADLRKKLDFRGIDIFIEYTLKLYTRNRKNAYSFLLLKTKTSNIYLKSISSEARLEDMKERMKKLSASICGRKIEIDDLSSLDSDELLEHGSTITAFEGSFYFPAKVSFYEDAEKNRDWYFFSAALSAATLYFKSFSTVHGTPGAENSLDYISSRAGKNPVPLNNIFVVAEVYRVLRDFMRYFPGAANAASRVISDETDARKKALRSFADVLTFYLVRSLAGKEEAVSDEIIKGAELVERITRKSFSYQNTADFVFEAAEDPKIREFIAANFTSGPSPLPFFPDYMFPASLSEPDKSNQALDQKEQSNSRKPEDDGNDDDKLKDQQSSEDGDGTGKEKKEEDNSIPSGFFYNEWNFLDNDYYENWCCLRERRPKGGKLLSEDKDYMAYTQRVRKIFEAMKPDLARKEKYLQEGDYINMDMLVEYISERKANIFRKENFYEKPFIKKRDIAVAVLMDISGSTGEKHLDGESVLETEKRSALILGEGLSVVGDSFAIYGFTGNGRENAEFSVFKDFEDEWNEKSKTLLAGATPGSSTRMGVAVRHGGYKLSQRSARKKILIVITDGKPMDSGYDPHTRYAQHDVRRANEENLRQGIDSFCISTEENKIEDLDIMFPFGRYIIIRSMDELPSALSKLYIGITK